MLGYVYDTKVFLHASEICEMEVLKTKRKAIFNKIMKILFDMQEWHGFFYSKLIIDGSCLLISLLRKSERIFSRPNFVTVINFENKLNSEERKKTK